MHFFSACSKSEAVLTPQLAAVRGVAPSLAASSHCARDDAGTSSLQDLDLGWCNDVTSESITAISPLTCLHSLQLARTKVSLCTTS